MATASVKYSVVIGLNVGNETLPDEVTAPLVAYVREELAQNFGGCTILRGLGGWYNDAGIFVSEPSVIAYAICEDDSAANYALFRSLAWDFKVLFNQECVSVERLPLQHEFIS